MKRLFSILAGICTTACLAQQNLKLRYNQPAGAVWENALPLGNGQAGAMVYGNVTTEPYNSTNIRYGVAARTGTITCWPVIRSAPFVN